MSRRLQQLTALRAFEAAARHLSFARAAEELHVTPGAISQQIKQLEDYLGITLFLRGRQLRLSDSAAAALPLFSEAFDQLERAVTRLRADLDNGPLVVSLPPVFASRWMIMRLEDFQARHPDIELRLHASRRLVDFAVDEVDVAIRFGSGPFTGLHVDRLTTEAVVPVASPALAAQITEPAELLNHALLHDEAKDWDTTFPDWDTWLSSLGVSGKPRIRHFSDTNLVIEAAMAGLGVALVWHSLVAADLQAGKLQRLFDNTLPYSHGYHLVMPPNRLQVPKIAAFRAWMLEQMQQQTEG